MNKECIAAGNAYQHLGNNLISFRTFRRRTNGCNGNDVDDEHDEAESKNYEIEKPFLLFSFYFLSLHQSLIFLPPTNFPHNNFLLCSLFLAHSYSLPFVINPSEIVHLQISLSLIVMVNYSTILFVVRPFVSFRQTIFSIWIVPHHNMYPTDSVTLLCALSF